MATKTANKTMTRKLTPAFALWKHKDKNGKPYFSGNIEESRTKLTAFFNTNKKNPKEPDVRVYEQYQDGKLSKEEYTSLWANVSEKTGKKYLSGKIGDKRVVGFVNEDTESKRPYVSVYFSEDEGPKQDDAEALPF